jgi:hypothetical protein
MMSQLNEVHTFTPYLYFRIISHLCLGLPNDLFNSSYQTQILCHFFIFFMCAAYPEPLIPLDLITLRILGSEYKL